MPQKAGTTQRDLPPSFSWNRRFWGPQLRYGPVDLALVPSLQVGSHSDRLGLLFHLDLHWGRLSKSVDWLFNWLQLAYHYSATSLGIPGPSHLFFATLGLGLTFGGGPSQKGLPFSIGRRAHSIFFQYEAFVDTLGTSQFSGALGYAYSQPQFTFRFLFENDLFVSLWQDEFRTGALALSIHFGRKPHVWGVGIGSLVWTGSTDRSLDLSRDRVYDMRGRVGGEYSHGILYGTLYYNACRLSVGWDSEAIRDAIQNSLHYLIDDGRILPLKRDDRFFLLFSCNALQTLY